jgi:hypothetical protein
MAQSSQRKEPPQIPGRFTYDNASRFESALSVPDVKMSLLTCFGARRDGTTCKRVFNFVKLWVFKVPGKHFFVEEN